MNAYRCDLCGELFANRGEIKVNSLAGIYYTLLIRTDNNAVIDICNSCRCRLQDVLDAISNDRIMEERRLTAELYGIIN